MIRRINIDVLYFMIYIDMDIYNIILKFLTILGSDVQKKFQGILWTLKGL